VTKLVLVYANKTVDDILLKKELDALVIKGAGRLNVFYTVDKLPKVSSSLTEGIFETKKGWDDLMEMAIGQPKSGKQILICGPSGFEDYVTKTLNPKGFDESDIFRFTQTQLAKDAQELLKAKTKPQLQGMQVVCLLDVSFYSFWFVEYTLDDVAKHTTHADGWLAIDGQVYDVTPFIGEHPGGDIISYVLA